MRTLNIPLEDKDYDDLLKVKGDKSWREFILGKKDVDAEKEFDDTIKGMGE